MSRIRREPTALAAAVKSAQRILLVCHGNIIRSPFAARLLARELGERTGVSVGAGGLEAVAGKPAHPTAVLMAAARGLDLADHLAAPLTAEAVAAADLILVMEVPHLLALASRFPQARSKTFLLTCLAPDLPLEIDDPVAGDEGRFQTCFEQIAAALRPILGFLGGPESVPPLTTSRGDRP
jgi:protein-tyrosine-phosphatase